MLRERYAGRLPLGASLGAVALILATLASCSTDGNRIFVGAWGRMATLNAPAPAVAPAEMVYKLLKTSPEQGPIGTSFTISGQGLPPGKTADVVWMTFDGSFTTKADQQTVEFHEIAMVEKRLTLGRATTDGEGRLKATFTAPEDYGDLHDIYVEMDGKQVAKGDFRIMRDVIVTPLEGPVGTEITVSATGLGWKPSNSTLAVLYDNKYTGFVSSTTTRGSAQGQFRAAGPPGRHAIEIAPASAATPLLNTRQGTQGLYEFRFTFNVTEDAGPPPPALEWPDDNRLANGHSPAKTTASGLAPTPGVAAAFEPASGPIRSKATLQARGLPAGAGLDLLWVSVLGNRAQSDWNMVERPLTRAIVGDDGSLKTRVEIPEDLGGWHVVKLVQRDKVLAEVPYFVERSLVKVAPARVKAGDTFTVQIKGLGWTELDNGVAVTYDNSYLGYACGFKSGGDVTLNLVATGGPGTHLIDLYPMIYQGHGKPPWSYQMPQLTFAQDAPGLALGYRLPAFRLAITIVD